MAFLQKNFDGLSYSEFLDMFRTSLLIMRRMYLFNDALSIIIFFLLFGLWDYRHCGHSWPIVPASGDNEDDCGEHDGM
jgi:hypothetical protein